MATDPQLKKNELFRYAGLTGQFLAGLAITVWGGMKIDEWLKIGTPLAVWVLPLLLISGIIIKIVKETGRKK